MHCLSERCSGSTRWTLCFHWVSMRLWIKSIEPYTPRLFTRQLFIIDVTYITPYSHINHISMDSFFIITLLFYNISFIVTLYSSILRRDTSYYVFLLIPYPYKVFITLYFKLFNTYEATLAYILPAFSARILLLITHAQTHMRMRGPKQKAQSSPMITATPFA